MKKIILILLLALVGLSMSGQITKQKAFVDHKGVYVSAGDTLTVTTDKVTVLDVEYDVVVDFGSKRNYGMALEKDGEEFFLMFNKRSHGRHISLLSAEGETIINALLAQEQKIE